MINILAEVWKVAGSPCATRLKAIVHLWQPWISQRFRLTPELEHQLLSISPRQIDRRLNGKKAVLWKRLSGRTTQGGVGLAQKKLDDSIEEKRRLFRSCRKDYNI